MNRDQILRVVAEWLREAKLPDLTPREMPPCDFGRMRTILAVVGPRRAGKTFYLYQLISGLIKSGEASREDILFVDFEDYRLHGFMPQDMDELLSVFEQLSGRPPRYLFFDEIQQLPQWSRVLRTLHNKRRHHIVVSGSNSSLLSGEIATELRGRYQDVLMLPLSFVEFLKFRKITYNRITLYTASRGQLINAFDDYLIHGGFPETLLQESAAEKRKILQNYYATIFYKDLLDRHGVKARYVLDQMMAGLLETFGSLFSISTFEKQLRAAGFSGSKRTIANYLHHMEEAFFLLTVEKFSMSARKRMMNPKKAYLIDTGFALLGGAFSENRGPLLENLVAIELFRRSDRMFYFREAGECDFIICAGKKPVHAMQVSWEVSKRNEGREVKGLIDAMHILKIKSGCILTHAQEKIIKTGGKTIRLIPVWKWLIGEE